MRLTRGSNITFCTVCLVLSIQLVLFNKSNAQSTSKETLFNRFSAANATSDSAYFIVEGRIPSSFRSYIVRTITDNIQILRNPGEQITQLRRLGVKIAPALSEWKMSPSLEKKWALLFNEKKATTCIITTNNLDELQAYLNHQQIPVQKIDFLSGSVVAFIDNKSTLRKLVNQVFVLFVDEFQAAHTEASIIGYNRSFHGINALDYIFPGINGKNIVVGVKEQNMDQTDLDLHQRVLPSTLAAPNIQAHATVIASIIGGAGNSFYDGRGLANQAGFFSSSFSNLFADDEAILRASKVSVQNHSYGTLPQQFYGAEALSYDLFAWRNKDFVHLFSAGNRGTQSATEGRYSSIPGFANLTGNFKMAKNIITVGAIDNAGNISSESSAGPIYDGRIAPQLVALGPNGTSDAAAVVTGTVALLQQVFADSNSQQAPPASLIKSVLYNTAEDVYSKGIDYKTGYGLLNSYKAVRAFLKRAYFSGAVAGNQQWTQNLNVPANAALLKVTLSWTDTAALLNNNKALINDLDLEVKEINTGQIYKPWILNSQPQIDSLRLAPVRGRDSLNTSEQISISLAAAGNYEIRVIGNTVNNTTIPFHIAYTIDTLNRFEFLSPQHSSDVNRFENERIFINWATAVADTNQTGILSISYDGGIVWNSVQTVKIYSGQYSWIIKDTLSRAQFRMETGFGFFYSKEFVIGPVTRPKLDFNCTDSIQLSWPKHVYASSYKIYALGTSPSLQVIDQTTDTFKVFNRGSFPYEVYAVEPILSNQIPASRSVAFNVNFQGVNCFYRTLNYNQLDNSSLNLVLEVGTSRYVDSIFFDVVTVNGVLIRQAGGTKANNTSVIYTQTVTDLNRGTNYFRVRIKLVNGQIISTNIVSITISGKQLILFYPNPALRKSSIQYVLQQGIPGDCRLTFYDIAGRMIKDYAAIPQKIDVSSFPSGLIIYKLIFPDGRVAETGKILVQ